jgi:hypothetical protein
MNGSDIISKNYGSYARKWFRFFVPRFLPTLLHVSFSLLFSILKEPEWVQLQCVISLEIMGGATAEIRRPVGVNLLYEDLVILGILLSYPLSGWMDLFSHCTH